MKHLKRLYIILIAGAAVIPLSNLRLSPGDMYKLRTAQIGQQFSITVYEEDTGTTCIYTKRSDEMISLRECTIQRVDPSREITETYIPDTTKER